MTSDRQTRTGFAAERELVADVALLGYTACVAAGFARVFSGWEFFTDLVIVAVVGHAVSVALRWLGTPAVVGVPLALLASVYTVAQQQLGATFAVIPGDDTWAAIDREIALVRDQFPNAVAPVLYGGGWALLAGVGIALAATLADGFAFRAHGRGEALVPGAVVFIFVAALGSDRLRVELSIAVLIAAVLAVIAIRWAQPSRTPRLRGGAAPLAVPAALGVALMVAAVGGWLGPRLPGADDEPLYETRGRSGTRTEIASPLVDIRSRLTNQSDLELFRVSSSVESYWRVTTLPEFDGRTFRLPARPLEQLDGDTPEAYEASLADGRRREVRQEVQVIALGGQTVPAAPDPYQAAGRSSDDGGLDLRINRDTSTLIAPDDFVGGEQFTVVSAFPQITSEQLDAASGGQAPDELFLALPDDLPDVVASTAISVTADAGDRYQQALALQTFFRNDFEYSLEVQAGHGANAIEAFLENRVGYCEQFAATYAAMARTLDIPSRVAVGYTSGELRDDGWYSVRGRNSHAWPELWFEGVGWVAFEPTPGRGAPGAEQYTGIAAQQDLSDGSGTGGGGTGESDSDAEADTGDGAPPMTTAPPTTLASDAQPAAPSGGTAAPLEAGQVPDGGVAQPAPSPADDGVPWTLMLLLTGGAALVATPVLVRRGRRLAEDRLDGNERVVSAWARAQRAVVDAGVADDPTRTTSEWVTAADAVLPVSARPLGALGHAYERVVFDRHPVDVPNASLWADQIEKMSADALSASQRARRYFMIWR